MGNQIIVKGKYRPEIDGLRAFAVFAVIINHFNKDILPSGYLGVDIFFVISGYVITSSLAGRKSKNFSDFITSFYERRIKRILPALVFFVLITSVVICLFHSNSSGPLKTGITSLFGLSNIALFSKAKDYFADSAALNPFTHTWSLGVEEQFYFLFPFLIWFSGFGRQTKKGARNLFVVILFLSIFSLIAFIYLYQSNQPAAYFLMPTRFWEMATGCLVFLGLQKKGFVIDKFKNASPFFVLMIMIGVLFLPISAAILSTFSIVFLSALLISCLREGTPIFTLLTNRKIIFIGLISYSLYLWHWGVLSISRWTIGIHWWSIPFQLGLIYCLALASYKWIETPLRESDWGLERWKTFSKGIFILVLTAVGLAYVEKQLKSKLYLGNSELNIRGRHFKSSAIDPQFCSLNPKRYNFKYSNEKIFKKCFEKNGDNEQTFFFVGDSHARAFWLGAERIVKETNSNFFTFTSGATTFPSIKYLNTEFENLIYKDQIIKSLKKEILSIIKEGDIVFIIMRFPYHFGDYWYDYPVKNFRFFDHNDKQILRNTKQKHFEEWLYVLKEFAKDLSKKNANIIISTPTPEFPQAKDKKCRIYGPQWFNKLSTDDCNFSFPIEFFTSKEGKYSYLIRDLKNISKGSKNLYLFDSLTEMCPNSECRYSLDGKALYTDDDHISNYSARYILAPKLLLFMEKQKLLNR